MRTTRAIIKDEQWSSSHAADCEQNDWQMPVKTLPFLVVGKKRKRSDILFLIFSWGLQKVAKYLREDILI